MDTGKKYVRINEIADYLSLKPRTIRAYILQKKIPYIKRNGIVLFELEEIDRWMQAGKVPMSVDIESLARGVVEDLKHQREESKSGK